MKLTWSEASVFAFVWACALGYIVASRILAVSYTHLTLPTKLEV